MGRYGNYPSTVEDCKTISITKLNEWNYLSYGNRSGTITWSTNGIENSSIGIVTCINESEKYIKLNYKTSTESISYKVKIVQKVSNLGKGYVNYFLCPHTKKLCRKLYFKDGYFFHRTAFNNLMYQSQIESKKTGLYLVYLTKLLFQMLFMKVDTKSISKLTTKASQQNDI